jgi:hypothetical protein
MLPLHKNGYSSFVVRIFRFHKDAFRCLAVETHVTEGLKVKVGEQETWIHNDLTEK